MHFYPHNIGDFNNATRHLTRVERSVYRDAIERYYDTESPLPAGDIERLCRILLCVTPEEKKALGVILEEFFTLSDGAYHHSRCDLEIEKYHSNTSAKARAGRASAESRKNKKQHVLNACSTDEQLNKKQETITKNQEPVINTYVADAKAPTTPDCPHQEILDLYHEILPTLSQVRLFTDQRKKQLRSRWRESDKHQSLDFWRKYFVHVSNSDFLMGRCQQQGGRTWQADFDFLTTQSKFVKVLEGQYHG